MLAFTVDWKVSDIPEGSSAALAANAHQVLALADLSQHRLVSLEKCLLSLTDDLLRAASHNVRDSYEAAQFPVREQSKDLANGIY